MSPYSTTVGSLLLGIFFNTFLYGLVAHQFMAYYKTSKQTAKTIQVAHTAPELRDRPAIKCMVLLLFILDTFYSISVIYMAWNYLVTNHNNPAALDVIGWPFALTPVGTALAALATQMFLGYRIWLLTTNKILYGVIILLAIPSFTLGLICSVETWNIRAFSKLSLITALMVAWLITQVIVDVFITITMTIIFTRSRTGFRPTDTVIDRLICCTIQTGLFSGIFCMAALVTFIAFPSTDLHGMFAIPIGRVYTNTLLHTLLIRKSLREKLASEIPISIQLGVGFTSQPNSPTDERSVQSARAVTGDV